MKYYRTWYWHVSEEGIRTAWGVVNTHEVLLQWYKVERDGPWFMDLTTYCERRMGGGGTSSKKRTYAYRISVV